MKLYIGNLSYDTTESQLQALLAAYGEVESVRILTDGDSGRSKGFGFAEFRSDEQARAAISGLNGKDLGGRAIIVNEARPKTDSGGGRGGGGGRGSGQGGYGGGGGGRNRY
jgi:RNA recognition motif-containing protein